MSDTSWKWPCQVLEFYFYACFCWTFENEVSMLDDLIVVSFLCCNTLCEAFLEARVWRLWFVGIIVLLELVAIWMSLVYKFLRYLCSTQYWSNANDAASSLDLLWNLSFVIRKQELRFRVCILWMLGSTDGERGMLGLQVWRDMLGWSQASMIGVPCHFAHK